MLLTLTLKRRSNYSIVTSRPDLLGYDQPALCTTIDGALPNLVIEVSSCYVFVSAVWPCFAERYAPPSSNQTLLQRWP